MFYANERLQGFYVSDTAENFDSGFSHDVPEGSVAITQNAYESAIANQNGAPWRLIDGKVVFQSQPVPSAAEILAAVKNEVRPLRDKFLSRVADIGAAAFATKNNALANEVFAEPDGVRRKLLDITDAPALNAAQTREEMEAAVLAYYASIVSNVSPELRGAFKGLEK